MKLRKSTFRGLTALILVLAMLALVLLPGCGKAKEKVIIYTSSEDFKIADLTERLAEKFPDYDITIEYKSTGDHAAVLVAEKSQTECDITHDLDYGYLAKLDAAGVLADLSEYDRSIYTDDVNLSDNYIIELRSGGAIILNTEVLTEKGLAEPTCYADLLKPEYKGLISMPGPKSSGTGYMFLKSLVNELGEEAALEYFDSLTENILAYTSSGSGPVNALVQKEAAIGLGMTAQAVVKINEGAPLKVIYFDEGSPFTLYGQSIIKGKETRTAVKEVFDYLITEYNYINNRDFFPEKIYKDKDYVIKNYPTNIVYADMAGNTIEAKEALLAKWDH